VGIALSLEVVYAIRSGDLFPDDRHYGILWLDEETLAAALDMKGAFGEVAIRLAPGGSAPGVIAAVDRILIQGGLVARSPLEDFSAIARAPARRRPAWAPMSRPVSRRVA
jgi:hypothetical protein